MHTVYPKVLVYAYCISSVYGHILKQLTRRKLRLPGYQIIKNLGPGLF